MERQIDSVSIGTFTFDFSSDQMNFKVKFKGNTQIKRFSRLQTLTIHSLHTITIQGGRKVRYRLSTFSKQDFFGYVCTVLPRLVRRRTIKLMSFLIKKDL